MTNDVSVIIPAYNCEAFLARALASVTAQTLSPREILVVDDCSSDGTRELVQAAAASDPRIRLIALPHNGGPSVARNEGFAAAEGTWVAILDADDAFAPQRLERLVHFGLETDADIVADDLSYFDAVADCVTGRGIGEAQEPKLGPINLHTYVSHNAATGKSFDWGLLKPIFRRETWRRLDARYEPTLRHGEDFKLMVELLCAGAKFHILNEPLYLYTQRQGSVSGQLSGMTRTTIGYGLMRDVSLALSEDPRIRRDPELARLFQQRAEGLGRFDDAHFVSTSLRSGTFRAIIARARQNPRFLPFMAGQLWRAIRRRLRRPATSKIGPKPG